MRLAPKFANGWNRWSPEDPNLPHRKTPSSVRRYFCSRGLLWNACIKLGRWTLNICCAVIVIVFSAKNIRWIIRRGTSSAVIRMRADSDNIYHQRSPRLQRDSVTKSHLNVEAQKYATLVSFLYRDKLHCSKKRSDQITYSVVVCPEYARIPAFCFASMSDLSLTWRLLTT